MSVYTHTEKRHCGLHTCSISRWSHVPIPHVHIPPPCMHNWWHFPYMLLYIIRYTATTILLHRWARTGGMSSQNTAYVPPSTVGIIICSYVTSLTNASNLPPQHYRNPVQRSWWMLSGGWLVCAQRCRRRNACVTGALKGRKPILQQERCILT